MLTPAEVARSVSGGGGSRKGDLRPVSRHPSVRREEEKEQTEQIMFHF